MRNSQGALVTQTTGNDVGNHDCTLDNDHRGPRAPSVDNTVTA